MNLRGLCPRCGTQLSGAGYTLGAMGPTICPCGWYDRAPELRADLDREKKTIFGMTAAALLMVATFAHLVSWGSYSMQIPVIKVKQITGIMSKEDYGNLAQACIALNKFSCAEQAFVDLYRNKGDLSGLSMLANLNLRLGDEPKAMAAYKDYFKAGGNDGAAALEYAKLLEANKLHDEAFTYFEASIASRPDLLPIQATSAIVRLLIKQGRYEEAYQRILAFHQSAENANGYLNTELTQLEDYLGKKKTQKLAVKTSI
jgi:tetratricopeptide (TPR) repeat protein